LVVVAEGRWLSGEIEEKELSFAVRMVADSLHLGRIALREDPREVVGQLVGRLCGGLSERNSVLKELVEECKVYSFGEGVGWWCPRKNYLTSPGGALKMTLEGHSSSVYSVAYSPCGKNVVSGSDDMTVRIWDVESGDEVRVMEGHSSRVTSVAYSPCGKYVVSRSWDYKVITWDTNTGTNVSSTIPIPEHGHGMHGQHLPTKNQSILGNFAHLEQVVPFRFDDGIYISFLTRLDKPLNPIQGVVTTQRHKVAMTILKQ
jgi:WD40 repeat protein